jgi:hypothetical protein
MPIQEQYQEQYQEQDLSYTPPTPSQGESAEEAPKKREGSSKVVTAKAQAILAYFNEVHRREYENTTTIQALLTSKKLSEPTLDDCKLVIDYLYHVERIINPEGYEKYCNVTTPFRPENFDRNRGKARVWEKQGRRPPNHLPFSPVNGAPANPLGLNAKEIATLQVTHELMEEAKHDTRGQTTLLASPGSYGAYDQRSTFQAPHGTILGDDEGPYIH